MIRHPSFAKALCAAGVLLATATPGSPQSQPAVRGRAGPPPEVVAADAPAGLEIPGVRWVKVTPSGVGTMLAAVARPTGRGPFPAVVLLHGSHGFAREYVQLAEDLARGGLIAVAPCWFSGGGGAGSRFVTPIACPDAPSMPSASSPEAMKTVDALVQAAGTLPGADPHRVGLFGHSRGGGAVLNYILDGGRVHAAVLHSAGYGPGLADRLAGLEIPILILHGTADSPADGGSEFTDVRRARDFEGALRRAGRRVEAMYYEGGGHNGFFTSPKQRRSEVGRMRKFFHRRLGSEMVKRPPALLR